MHFDVKDFKFSSKFVMSELSKKKDELAKTKVAFEEEKHKRALKQKYLMLNS